MTRNAITFDQWPSLVYHFGIYRPTVYRTVTGQLDSNKPKPVLISEVKLKINQQSGCYKNL